MAAVASEHVRRRSARVRGLVATCLAGAAALLLLGGAAAGDDRAAPTDRDLLRYAAHVGWRITHDAGSHTFVCQQSGSAIYLGGNRFLTAAHVVDQNPLSDDCARFGIAAIEIETASSVLRARVVRQTTWSLGDGGLAYPDNIDLALLEVDARMLPLALRGLAPTQICAAEAPAERPVKVAAQYGVYPASTRPSALPNLSRVAFRARAGHSGGGVYDPVQNCLLGIVSSGGTGGANYVSNQALRRFLSVPDGAGYAAPRRKS